jgi:hypothetical protein
LAQEDALNRQAKIIDGDGHIFADREGIAPACERYAKHKP